MPLSSGAGGSNSYPANYPSGTGVTGGIGDAVTSPAFPATPATPSSYSGTFIPEIWSSKLLEKFYDATVLGAIANTAYEGEVSNYGDKVIIRQRPTIAISDYTPDTQLAVQRPNADVVELTIDYAKYFAFVIDDIWDVQSDMDQMSLWAEDASEQMKIVIDQEVMANVMLGAAGPTTSGTAAGRKSGDINLGATTTPVTVVPRNAGAGETEVIDLLLNIGQAFDEENVPETGRWAIIPAWMAAMIKKSELRDASLSGDGTSMLRNGRLGMIDRFELYMSNLLPSGTAAGLAAGETAIFAGTKHAVTFASQLTKMEGGIRSEFTFGTIMRGLQVYGCDVLKDNCLAEAIVAKA